MVHRSMRTFPIKSTKSNPRFARSFTAAPSIKVNRHSHGNFRPVRAKHGLDQPPLHNPVPPSSFDRGRWINSPTIHLLRWINSPTIHLLAGNRNVRRDPWRLHLQYQMAPQGSEIRQNRPSAHASHVWVLPECGLFGRDGGWRRYWLYNGDR